MAPARIYIEEIPNFEGVRRFKIIGKNRHVILEKNPRRIPYPWCVVEGYFIEGFMRTVALEIDKQIAEESAPDQA